MNEAEWNRLINGLRDGQQDPCTDFWNRFGSHLEAVAQRQLSSGLQRSVGPDDLVQSACRTFFRRISDGQFHLPDADALWRLMCAITLTKASRAARDHSRTRRGQDAEPYLESWPADSDGCGFELSGNGQSPLVAAEFSDQMNRLLSELDSEECLLLDLKLQNHTNHEIARRMNCSEWTVRRLTERIRSRWTTLFEEERGGSLV
jgi:RNA polymerase sigma factor (sigma-70 family)